MKFALPSVVGVKVAFICLVSGFLVGGLLGGWVGYEAMAAKYYREKAQLTEKIAQLTAEGSKVVIKYETVFVDRVKTVYVKGKERIKEVPIYVNADDDAACELRNGFVRLYDASLRGGPPGPATDSDREPSGIALSRAAEDAILPNNTELLACRERLKGWQEFYKELQEIHRK